MQSCKSNCDLFFLIFFTLECGVLKNYQDRITYSSSPASSGFEPATFNHVIFSPVSPGVLSGIRLVESHLVGRVPSPTKPRWCPPKAMVGPGGSISWSQLDWGYKESDCWQNKNDHFISLTGRNNHPEPDEVVISI
jgi:hypothetical protein